MDSCLFCKIIKGEIPCYKVYEDEYTIAFLDISKDIDGHTLVLPKKHFKNILDVDDETLKHVIETVKLVSKHYTSNCGFNGINIINNNEECAEQSIPHLHIHILPRKDNDNYKVFPSLSGAKHSLGENLEKLRIN